MRLLSPLIFHHERLVKVWRKGCHCDRSRKRTWKIICSFLRCKRSKSCRQRSRRICLRTRCIQLSSWCCRQRDKGSWWISSCQLRQCWIRRKNSQNSHRYIRKDRCCDQQCRNFKRCFFRKDDSQGLGDHLQGI